MSLENYFSPLNAMSLVIWILMLLTGEVIGGVICNRLKFPLFTRLFWWLPGIMLWINLWYFLSPLISFKKNYLWGSLAFLFFAFGFFYIRQKLWRDIWFSIKKYLWVIIFLIPLMPALGIKLSLPPYFADEIGYHYISPIEVTNPELVSKRQNLYYFLPQSLDNLYRVSFALSQSYSAARLLHLSIIISALLVVGVWLRMKLGSIPYIVWSITCWYIAVNFSSMATNGLVDMGTAGVVLVSVLITIELIIKKELSLLLPLGVMWGAALSFKYSSLIPMAAHSTVLLIVFWRQILKQKMKFAMYAFWSFCLYILFGGFWLIRNYAITGKLIYGVGNATKFFGGWTIPLWPFNPFIVSKELFTGSYYLGIILFISIIISLWQLRTLPRYYVYLLSGWLLEWIIVWQLGGFIIRYYFHWIYIALVLMIGASLGIQKQFLKIIYLFTLLLVLLANARNIYKFVYTEGFAPPREVRYATGEATIKDWLQETIPTTYSIVDWCSRREGQIESIYITDPNLMWVTRQGDFQGFLVDCSLNFYDLGYDNKALLDKEKNEYLYVASVSRCTDSHRLDQLVYNDPNDIGWSELRHYPYSLKQRSLNNELICGSEEIVRNLYRVRSEDFKLLVNRYKR